MMRELEISAFTADLRADQQLRAVALRKPCRVPIPLHETKTLVKEPGLHCHFFLQRDIDRHRFAQRLADQKNFGRPVAFQEINQPFDPRIVAKRIPQRLGAARFLRAELPGN